MASEEDSKNDVQRRWKKRKDAHILHRMSRSSHTDCHKRRSLITIDEKVAQLMHSVLESTGRFAAVSVTAN